MFSVPITGDVEQKELVKLDRAGRAGQSWEIFTSVRINIVDNLFFNIIIINSRCLYIKIFINWIYNTINFINWIINLI